MELVTFPSFLSVMPTSFDSPEKYDKDGQPVDREERERWKERKDYVKIIQSAENKDNVLSRCLSNQKGSALSYSMVAYKGGKLGFYDKVIDEQGKIAQLRNLGV
ncbi:hypothetical protein F5Y15DRAFT_348161 [Xylariaceae sp. FL0016]|nr:hypothetical protein F5Y15DRAFT_348161 [Xylariaceae sp. FL0016]